jgi:hypothetical protein
MGVLLTAYFMRCIKIKWSVHSIIHTLVCFLLRIWCDISRLSDLYTRLYIHDKAETQYHSVMDLIHFGHTQGHAPDWCHDYFQIDGGYGMILFWFKIFLGLKVILGAKRNMEEHCRFSPTWQITCKILGRVKTGRTFSKWGNMDEKHVKWGN